MTLPRNMTRQSLHRLMRVAQFKEPATTWIRNGTVLNIYTGELLIQNVAILDDRIAYVGQKEPLVDYDTTIVDASNKILVPGYIEPHAHSFQIYNPVTLSEYALRHGTTTLIHDNLPFFIHMNQTQLEQFFDAMWKLPVKTFWWARVDPQIQVGEMAKHFDLERVRQVMNHPLVLQAGELTDWASLLQGKEAMVNRIWEAKKLNKRIETHNPGASEETLNAVGAAGVTACHESISAEDVLRRIRLGYHTALRHSSIRPDLKQIVSDLLELQYVPWDKTFFTTDGSPPFYLKRGFIDDCIREALDAGLDPVMAYRMASHHAAVYYGIDHEVGGISSGRLADIVFLEDLRDPTPITVMADGEIMETEKRAVQKPFSAPINDDPIEWEKYGIQSIHTTPLNARRDWFRLPQEFVSLMQTFKSGAEYIELPVIRYRNAVITKTHYETFELRDGHAMLTGTADTMFCALIHRNGKWITNGLVEGLGHIDALATSSSLSGDVMVLGTDKEGMAKAVNRVVDLGGGLCVYQGGKQTFELPLPLFGLMSKASMEDLIEDTTNFLNLMREAGYSHSDPIYSLLFLSATHLPSVRMTPEGIYDVRKQQVLIPSVSL